jgi:hypothetical protein
MARLTLRKAQRHPQRSPFPLTLREKGDVIVVVDERCKCGLLRSEHMDTTQYGHGMSFDGTCQKFTWASFVKRDET